MLSTKRSQLVSRFQLTLFWSTNLRSIIQAEVVHRSLAKSAHLNLSELRVATSASEFA